MGDLNIPIYTYLLIMHVGANVYEWIVFKCIDVWLQNDWNSNRDKQTDHIEFHSPISNRLSGQSKSNSNSNSNRQKLYVSVIFKWGFLLRCSSSWNVVLCVKSRQVNNISSKSSWMSFQPENIIRSKLLWLSKIIHVEKGSNNWKILQILPKIEILTKQLNFVENKSQYHRKETESEKHIFN